MPPYSQAPPVSVSQGPQAMPVNIRGGKSDKVLILDKQEWTAGRSTKEIFLYGLLREDKKTISENQLFFHPFKEVVFPRAKIKFELEECEKGVNIFLRSKLFIPSLFLKIDAPQGFFSDNFFNLLPGVPKEIKFFTSKKVNLKGFKKDLKFFPLKEAFE